MSASVEQADTKMCRTELDALIWENATDKSDLIAALQAIQQKFHYLPKDALSRVAELLDCHMSDVMGVATFYRQFRLKPAGSHTIRVCVGTACHVKGANQVYDKLKEHLQIPENEDTDEKGEFTVEKVACIGCCMLAPAVQIDEVTYGPLVPNNSGSIIHEFRKERDTLSQTSRDRSSGHEKRGCSGEIRICRCSSCAAAGANAIHQALQDLIDTYGFPVSLKTVGCKGSSWEAPLIEISLGGGEVFRYSQVKAQNLHALLRRHFKASGLLRRGKTLMNAALERILLPQEHVNGSTGTHVENSEVNPAIRYFGPQRFVVTEHQGEHDPLDLDEYEKHGGFAAYRECLKMKHPHEIIEIVRDSGLRGRGGGGFLTGQKWELVASVEKQKKYLICNGDEGDPGAFMDRMILESFPYRVIEGIAIAALAVGADEGYAYVRAEYGLAIQRFEAALKICRERGILADEYSQDTGKFNLQLVKGAGAFVCGEETALIESIEGRRGTPIIRPPYPSECGLREQPTLVNNVETYASIPWILRNGAQQFSKLGTDSSKGTKTFALAGNIERSGLIEVPMGVTIRQIVEEIGGGIPGGKQLKAVQIGGPSGGCIPASQCDLPIDYEALKASGAIMGSGGLVVLDEDTCMVDLARYFMEFIQDESCGKCTFCRVGTRRMLEILERLCQGKGKKGDLEKLEKLGNEVRLHSLCGLGKTGPNPVLSTLKHFREEYEAHLQGKCPAGKCKDLIQYRITDACIGCTICVQHCATGAIPFTPYEVHTIDLELCTSCDECRQVCPTEGAVVID